MKDKILVAAVRVAARVGLRHISRELIGKEARVAPSLVSYYFEGMDGARTAIIEKAIADQHLGILASAIAQEHPAVKNLDVKLKRKALQTLVAE